MLRMQQKSLADCAVREIVVFSAGGRQITGIVIAQDNGYRRSGVLNLKSKPDNGDIFMAKFVSHDLDIISLGDEWIIEPILHDDTVVCNSTDLNRPGCVFMTGDILSICANYIDQGQQTRIQHRSSANLSAVYPNHNSTLFDRWRIWQNKEEMTRPNGVPIIDVPERQGATPLDTAN